MNLEGITIKSALDSFDKGEFSSEELASEYLKVIGEKDKNIHAYLEVYGDVLDQAKNNPKGIPLAIKDNILINGRVASAASKILENYKAVYDATAIEKLKDAGSIFLGRTNMDEFAMGGSTENSAYGPTKNPHDLERVPGGSSGGSAAAVAAGETLAAIGSDTGGSIRQPSAFCGVVGLKPTYGRVSRYGLMAMGSSLDQIGPITKTVADSKILLDIMAGLDPRDGTTISNDTYENRGKAKVIGVPESILQMDGLDSGVLKNFQESIEKLKSLGYEIRDVSFEHLSLALATYYIIMPAEVSSNMARYDGIKYGYRAKGDTLEEVYQNTRSEALGVEVKRRIMLGTYVLSTGYFDEYYGKANTAREVIKKDFERIFKDVDVIATPTTPTPAFKIGEKINDPVQMYLADIFTVPANIAGVPAISIPAGKVDGLPVGLQLIAPHGAEEVLFGVGEEFEK
ncbi:MAG: Asp-tRNA(Asn)/Glu-tRNA(Gln) amidotransferase subunit GatA [Candidatus Pacebacteria bacterium]|nr:Asp-tRNA(Asn)/Glu-tRNA(Gln) amidotransferase subunit GatA [Candidatus Paceibacterota bacterium]